MAALRILFIWLIVLYSSLWPTTYSIRYEDGGTSESLRLQKGKEKLDEFTNTADHSSCWSKALEDLHTSCKSMAEDDQRRLALSFTNCHFQASDRVTYPCPIESTIAECTSSSRMDDAAFQVYTEFFTHTSNICFFLQSELWQTKTENTINRLSDTSSMAVEKLEQSLDYHRKLEEKQTQAIKNQDDILTQDAKIAESLANTQSNMNNAFQEMYTKAETQKLMLDEALGTLKSGFGSIQWILSSILGEIITLETAGFFIVTMVIITFLPQFGTSRLWLLGTLILYAVLEGIIKRLFFAFADSAQPNSMSYLHTCLWYNRWAACVLLCAVFYWRYLVFTGRERKQENLLEGLSKQLEYIQQSLPCTPNRNPHLHLGESVDGSFTEPPSELPSTINTPTVVPLKDLYQQENQHGGAGNIVSGTQLVDFLSGLYINNIQSDIEVRTSISDDDTYRPAPPSVISSSDNESHDYIEHHLTGDDKLTRPSLSRPHPCDQLDASQLTCIDDEEPLVPSLNDSLTSTVSLNIERRVPPMRNPTHFNNRRKAASVARDDPSRDTEYRESTPLPNMGKTKRHRKPRKRINNRNEDDDSGFSTDGSTMRPPEFTRRYNLRPRKTPTPTPFN